MLKKNTYILLLILPVLILSGCWDKVEIDERNFVTAIGFDKYEGTDKEKEKKLEKEYEGQSIDRYVRTISYPNTEVIAGEGEGDPSFTYSTTCISFADGIQQIALRDNKNYYTSHVKVIMCSEGLMKDERLFREIFDGMQRSVAFNRKLYFFVTPGKAQEILTADTNKNMDVGLYIEELMDKEFKSPRRAQSNLGTIVQDLYESKAALTPRIVKSDGQIKVSGSGVLKGNKMVGMLGELETRDALILKGETKSADFTIKADNIYMVISQTGLKSKMKAYEDKDGNINVLFKVTSEGDLLQHYFRTPNEPFNNKYLEKVNKKANELISKELENLFKKVQKDFKADIFQVGENLRKFQPDTWDKVKDNWDEIYPKAKVKVDFDMRIRRVGIQG